MAPSQRDDGAAALAAVVERLRATRPQRAAELDRPLAEEALLAAVVTALDAGELAVALAARPPVDRVALWGADPWTRAGDADLDAALAELAPGAGAAAQREAEPDLVVVAADAVLLVDVATERPGHLAARAARGERVPQRRLEEVARVLELPVAAVAADLAAARSAALGLLLSRRWGRPARVVALVAGAPGLLRPRRPAPHLPVDGVTWQALPWSGLVLPPRARRLVDEHPVAGAR